MNLYDNKEARQLRAHTSIPYGILQDVNKLSGGTFTSELEEIYGFYDTYKLGATFNPDNNNGDYIHSELLYKKIKTLIDKEARFMFSKPPTITIESASVDELSDLELKDISTLNMFVSKVLETNKFNSNIIKAEKDCQIGRRICIVVNVNETGIDIDFLNAKEFYYEFEGKELSRLVIFSLLKDSANVKDRRYIKKHYRLEDGKCKISQQVYDGSGTEVEDDEYAALNEDIMTNLSFIPAVVLFNEGLLNDILGVSVVEEQEEYEKSYSKLANTDIDTQRKSMSPVKYTIDASEGSTKNLSSGPGAYWDIQSDDNGIAQKQASVGILENSMSYSEPLKNTLDRVKSVMYEEASMPDVNSEQLLGLMTSGKAMRAIYWDLTVKCDEKMLYWIPAIRFVVNTVISFGRENQQWMKKYISESIPMVEYDVRIENNYSLLDDENEEKAIDLQEVESKTLSRKSYMKKWRNLNDSKIEEELRQIAYEREILEDSQLFGN